MTVHKRSCGHRTLGSVLGVMAIALLAGCDSDGSTVTPPEPPGSSYLRGENVNLLITSGQLMPGFIAARVSDDRFRGIPDVAVRWSLSGLVATIHDLDGTPLDNSVTLTDQNGYARIRLHADTSNEEGTVTATADGLLGSPAVFHVTVVHPLDVFVQFMPVFDCTEASQFFSEGRVNDIVVKLGGSVRFKYGDTSLAPSCRAVVASTSTPPGGASFRSDSLAPAGTFRFKPGVTGTWEFIDAVNGGGGILTVRQ